MANSDKGKERRKFMRLDFITPLAFKVCKKKTLSKILEGYTANISQGGILCNIAERVSKGDILWLSFDKGTLSICADIDRQSLIYQNGVIGKVVRIEPKGSKNFSVGIQFITREEKNISNIFPKIHFMKEEATFEREEV
ncbi:MAG: PilZ domain-containing protein [Candidatus Omnitrophica bacterium]|nr:PilZ domain-containing protein [Candidatus Omnitrophota bacterium]MDD5653522.1 PilZ domain-containing protein [Candidatus Omnitrophota bacterium]